MIGRTHTGKGTRNYTSDRKADVMTLKLAADSLPLRLDQDGTVRVGCTRVTLDSVIADFEQGATPEQIASDFPSLQLADIYTVIGYYLSHRSDVEAYLREQEQQAEEVRRMLEARLGDQRGLRERLLSRRAGRQN